jgi:hypothetical protein
VLRCAVDAETKHYETPDPSLTHARGVERIDGLILGAPTPGLLTTFVMGLQGNVIWYSLLNRWKTTSSCPLGTSFQTWALNLREIDLARQHH